MGAHALVFCAQYKGGHACKALDPTAGTEMNQEVLTTATRACCQSKQHKQDFHKRNNKQSGHQVSNQKLLWTLRVVNVHVVGVCNRPSFEVLDCPVHDVPVRLLVLRWEKNLGHLRRDTQGW